jgi:nitroreductase
MSNSLIQTIFSRRSIRSYTSTSVDEKHIKTLLEAAMAAPSASNLKPWHFVVVTHRQILDTVHHPFGRCSSRRHYVAVCGDPTISARFWVQDCSAATENLLLATAALGLGAVWLGVYPLEERVAAVREILRIPQTIYPLNLVSVGYPAEEKEPRTQYEEARVHREHW